MEETGLADVGIAFRKRLQGTVWSIQRQQLGTGKPMLRRYHGKLVPECFSYIYFIVAILYYFRAYFEETVKLANRLRPKATWGYYIYPKCYNLKKRDGKPCAPAAYQYIKE